MSNRIFDRAYRPEAGGRPIVVVYTGAADYPETLTGKDEEHARKLAAFLNLGEAALRTARGTLLVNGYSADSPTVLALSRALGDVT